jgi:predicted NBD/HSP70 family sugar kinase
MLRFGIDLGGTKTEGAILDGGGREIFRERAASSRDSLATPIARNAPGDSAGVIGAALVGV